MQMGILSNWDTLTLGTSGQTAVMWRSLGIPLQQWCEYDSGYTCKWEYSLTGIHSHWGQMVRRWSRGKVSASLYNNGVNTTADTHANGDTL